MSATNPGVCLGSGTTHTISVTARDLDGIKSISISGNGVSKTCNYTPPTTVSKTCSTTWSSVGKQAGIYSFTAEITDACDNVVGTNCTVSVMGGAITANGPCDKKLVLYNPYNDAVAVLDTYSGVACSTSYNWIVDQGGDKAEVILGAKTITCTVRAKAASTAVDDVRLRLTYTRGGVNCYSYFYTTVQKPSSLTREDLGYDPPPTCNPQGDMTRWFRDTVHDQFGSTVANATWDESWTGGCGLEEGDTTTGCNGAMIGNDEWSRWGFACTVGNDLWCTDDQTVNVSGWGCKLKYQRWDYLGPSPNPHIDAEDLGCGP